MTTERRRFTGSCNRKGNVSVSKAGFCLTGIVTSKNVVSSIKTKQNKSKKNKTKQNIKQKKVKQNVVI